MESIKWHIQDEWSPLKAVMVGIGEGMGLAPTLAETYDPQSRLHVAQGTYPTEDAVAHELNCLAEQLTRKGIQVLRPDSIGINQVFTRDIGLVIDGKFIMTHLVEDRVNEQKGLESMLNRYPGTLIHPPASVRMEGGDIMPMGDEIWGRLCRRRAVFKVYHGTHKCRSHRMAPLPVSPETDSWL